MLKFWLYSIQRTTADKRCQAYFFMGRNRVFLFIRIRNWLMKIFSYFWKQNMLANSGFFLFWRGWSENCILYRTYMKMYKIAWCTLSSCTVQMESNKLTLLNRYYSVVLFNLDFCHIVHGSVRSSYFKEPNENATVTNRKKIS